MATFPTLEPIARSYDLGSHLVTDATGQNGDTVQFLHSVHAAGVPLSLSFRGLTASQLQLIRNHYIGQRGTTLPFMLPAEVWRMHASLYDVVLQGMSYRYSSPISETRLAGGLFDVSVSLISHF